jgi:CheY-like chemotaxis protein
MARRFLIVDDNAHFLGAARDLLEREGVSVVGVASTGAEALRLVRELQPDVILVDVDLGDESGFDLAQRLAAGEAAPVVLISAYPEAEFAELITASSAVGFVSKSELSASAVSEVLSHGDGGRDRAR